MLSRAMFQSTRTGFSRAIISRRAKKSQLRLQLPLAPVRTSHHTTNFDPEAITPGTSSNVREPISSTKEGQAINISRGLKGQSDTADGSSVQSPISSRYRDHRNEGRAGEDEPTTEAILRNDPSMSDEEKKRSVEQAGRKWPEERGR